MNAPNAKPLPAQSEAGWVRTLRRFSRAAVELLRFPDPDTPRTLRRIEIMERDVVLPLKVAGIAMLVHSFYFSPWIGRVLGALDIAIEWTQFLLWIYILVNLAFAVVLFRIWRLPPPLVQWTVFASGLTDGILMSAMTLVTGGYDSPLFWLFVGLIIRSAVSVPRATSQLLLNLTLVACYVFSGLVYYVISDLSDPIDPDTAVALDLYGPIPAEPLLVRLFLLFLMVSCSYGVQILFERQRRALEEAREFAMREGQLRSAGRLAAEFAHQIKNPLAIINNAAFSLQRSLQRGNTDVAEQVGIIQEEVERSDRIITEIMGYAQLSEGRVEKLDVRQELDAAIGRVFPPAAGYPVVVRHKFDPEFPPLLMQRRHLSESLVNVLQNAREALEGRPGEVFVSARCRDDSQVEISVRDNGPGVPPDKLEKIFEAYYTTKEKGTGLGLASVKHSLELYGGSVRVESELGKGACFILTFPSKTPVRPAQSE